MKILLTLTLTLTLFVFGFFLSHSNTINLVVLNELKSIVREYATSQNKKSISIHISNVGKVGVKNDYEEEIYNTMKKNNIYGISYSNENNESISYMLDFFFGNNKYYIYSSDGYTEDLQVISINDFIDKFRLEQKEQYFSVCEKLDQKNWFYCENNH